MENNKNQVQKEKGVFDQVSEIEAETEEELTDIQEQEKTLEETLHEEVNQLKDKDLRAEAEIQNVRKMADQQTTKARLYGSESFAKEILSLVFRERFADHRRYYIYIYIILLYHEFFH